MEFCPREKRWAVYLLATQLLEKEEARYAQRNTENPQEIEYPRLPTSLGPGVSDKPWRMIYEENSSLPAVSACAYRFWGLGLRIFFLGTMGAQERSLFGYASAFFGFLECFFPPARNAKVRYSESPRIHFGPRKTG